MKRILLATLCLIFLVSCASKRAAIVDSTITEAKVLQALAKVNGLEVSAADTLLSSAEKQSEAGQTEAAFLLADEAILQFQISLLERENKNMSDSLKVVTESLNIYRTALEERKNARR